jgi:formate C-acetyltransferase
MNLINERNSDVYRIPFEKAIKMIDGRGEKSHVQNDADIISMLLDLTDPFYEDYEEVCGRFPHEHMMLRMTWRRMGLRDGEFNRAPRIAKHQSGCDTLTYDGWCDYGHTSPGWDDLLSLGFVGILARLEEGAAREDVTEEQRDFYTAGAKVWRATLKYMKKSADIAEGLGKQRVADTLRALTVRPPETLWEAMTAVVQYYDMQQMVESTPVRALGRLDHLLYPFYKKDIENGIITKKDAADMTDSLLLKLEDYKVPANIAFAIGGTRYDGTNYVNEYSYILLDRLVEMKLPHVKVHFLYGKGMPEDFMRIVFEGIRKGSNSFVFISDKATKAALEGIGISKEDADYYTVIGCYETAGFEEVPCTCAGRINLAKAVELTLTGGYDILTGRQIDSLKNCDFATFDEFYEAYLCRLDECCEAVFDLLDARESMMGELHTAPFYSATMRSAVARGKDVYSSGGKYCNTSINALGLATAVDSIVAIKKLVFDDKKIPLAAFVDVLKSNWEGQELLRQRIKKTYPKYGTGISEVDGFARATLERLAKNINGRPNAKGGVYRLGAFTVDWRFAFGEKTAASADGRLAGETLSKNISATLGCDREGATAHILSAAKLGGEITPNGSVVDIALHYSAVRGENGYLALRSSLDTFVDAGGASIQYNVLNAETLREAQKDPEKYPNLQVRVCGWNATFVSLTEKEQNEFIEQAEEGV